MKLDKDTRILIISHFTYKEEETSEVFPGNIRNFLIKEIGKLTYIDHPFIKSQGVSSPDNYSQMKIYDHGMKTYEYTAPRANFPTIGLFIYQLFLTIFFIFRKPLKYDVCIACDNLSLISVFLLRKMGIIKKLIYYTVDYSPKRYSNPILNNLYHYMDRLSSVISDVNWIVVENMISAKTKNGLNLQKCAPFEVVPIGFNITSIPVKSIEQVNRFNLIFVGFLFEKQGLQIVIDALPELIKNLPKIKLIVIGSGPFEKKLRKSVIQKKLKSYVKFTGYINNHQQIVKYLTDYGGIGLAPYVPSIGDYTFHADPSKIKLYLSCGLPVITTSVPPIAKEIAKRKAGLVINYSSQDLINSLSNLLIDKSIYTAYRSNALKMAREYDISFILNKAFKNLS